MHRQRYRAPLAAAVLGLTLALAACSSASMAGSSTSNGDTTNIGVNVGPTTPNGSTLTALNAYREAFAHLPRAATPSDVKRDCTLLKKAYTYGQPYASSPGSSLGTAGATLYAATKDLKTYGCPSGSPTPTRRYEFSHDIIAAGTALNTIDKILRIVE